MFEYKLEYSMEPQGEVITYILIVLQNSGVIKEVIPRCLTNFKNYVVVGIRQENGDMQTTTLFETENTLSSEITMVTEKYRKESTKREMNVSLFSTKAIDRMIRTKAKDILFNFEAE